MANCSIIFKKTQKYKNMVFISYGIEKIIYKNVSVQLVKQLINSNS